MTTIDERLAEILQTLVVQNLERSHPVYGTTEEAHEAIRTLFLDLIAEAKPEKQDDTLAYYEGQNHGVDQYENNLKQAINGGKK